MSELDFLQIRSRDTNRGYLEVYPGFKVMKSKHLMIRGGVFYAIWNYTKGMWSTDEYDVQWLIDRLLYEHAEKLKSDSKKDVRVMSMTDYSSGSWSMFKTYSNRLADNYMQLDDVITFDNSPVKLQDYVSRRLSYSMMHTPTPSFDELFGTLYTYDELQKILWGLGSIIDGSSKTIQKFFVLFGPPGTGKSTVLNLIQTLFEGYYTGFEAQTLTSNSNSFPTEMFRSNPLVGINHEGDLSNIRDNSLLNSIVSHDAVIMNVKYEKSHSLKLNTMLFVATNKPVAITDANSGIIRRLIDIRPTGNKVPTHRYDELIKNISFELGGIAYKSLNVFRELGKDHYNDYKPVDMMMRTNVFFNFVDHNFYSFLKEDWITLTRAWALYIDFCEEANIKYRLPKYKFRDEFKSYWESFSPTKRVGGTQYRSVYDGFKSELLVNVSQKQTTKPKKKIPTG